MKKRNILYLAGGAFCLLFGVMLGLSQKQNETSIQAIAPSPNPVSTQPVQKDWKEYLPKEDAALRKRYETDAYIKGWFMADHVWVGRAETDDLLKRGFFINANWKFNGLGVSPPGGKFHGSCTMTEASNPPSIICGKGQWGVQNDQAIEALQQFIPPS